MIKQMKFFIFITFTFILASCGGSKTGDEMQDGSQDQSQDQTQTTSKDGETKKADPDTQMFVNYSASSVTVGISGSIELLESKTCLITKKFNNKKVELHESRWFSAVELGTADLSKNNLVNFSDKKGDGEAKVKFEAKNQTQAFKCPASIKDISNEE